MAPKGGARQPIKVIATNETNPDDIKTFDSLTSAAKGVNAPGHNTIKRHLKTGEVYNGYRLSMLEPPTTLQEVPTSTTIDPESHHNEFTFFDEVDDLFKGQKVRYTREQPLQVSVFDIIRVVTNSAYPHKIYSRLQIQYPEVWKGCPNLIKFSGSGEKPTPVCNVQTMIELINLLPGERAARFRQAGAKVLVRVLGGDETLVDEIRDNATRMEQNAMATSSEDVEPHPMNMFQLPDGLTGTNAVCSLMLSPNMKGKTVADFRKCPCTYLILFKHEDKAAIKFGWTKNLKERVKEHNRMYPDMKVWCAINCKYSECAEETEKLFKGKMSAYLQTIQLETKDGPSKPSTEVLFNVAPEVAEKQMHAALETVFNETSIHNPILLMQLQIELEKTRATSLQAENERMRLLIEMHQCGIHHSPLGQVAMQPSPPLV